MLFQLNWGRLLDVQFSPPSTEVQTSPAAKATASLVPSAEDATEDQFVLLARAVHFAIERRRARAELDLRAARLEKNRAALRDIVEASADVILILDRTGAVRFVNSGAEKMYGRSAVDLVGQAGGFAIQPGTVEIDIALPGGTARTAEVRTVEIEWDGQPASLILLHDVTERKLAQEQALAQNVVLEDLVRERTAELVAANAELEAFAYSVSHDLRAPLRHIKGFTQMLEEEAGADLGAPARALLDRILGSVDRMQKLIDDLIRILVDSAAPSLARDTLFRYK